MERKQKRRLYYFPRTSGLSKYVTGNGARCVTRSSGLQKHCKRERQHSLDANSLYCLLCHTHLCNFGLRNEETLVSHYSGAAEFPHYSWFYIHEPSNDCWPRAPSPLFQEKRKSSLEPTSFAMYSKHTGHLPIHFACLFWDLPTLLEGKFFEAAACDSIIILIPTLEVTRYRFLRA